MIFVVIAGAGSEGILGERIRTFYGAGKSIQIHPERDGEWLVAAAGTAVEVSDRLGITEKPDDIPIGIVLAVAGYWGREPNSVWEWITANGS
jgi:hypothetical protein